MKQSCNGGIHTHSVYTQLYSSCGVCSQRIKQSCGLVFAQSLQLCITWRQDQKYLFNDYYLKLPSNSELPFCKILIIIIFLPLENVARKKIPVEMENLYIIRHAISKESRHTHDKRNEESFRRTMKYTYSNGAGNWRSFRNKWCEAGLSFGLHRNVYLLTYSFLHIVCFGVV